MRHVIATAALLAGLSVSVATAQSAEPRLAGAPQRACTDEEIRQALDGSYAGEPCSFRQMPQAQPATRPGRATASPSPQSAGPVLTQSTPPVARAPVEMVTMSGVRQGSSSRSYAYYEQSGEHQARLASAPASTGSPARYAEPARSETVTLGPEFFNGPLVGGVEAPLPALYSYRRIILIDAAGGVQPAGPGTALVYAMDRQARPPQPGPLPVRRVYPVDY